MTEAPAASATRAWDLAARVIDLARGLIVADNPFLSSAIGLLRMAPAKLADPFATDGRTLHVDGRRLLDGFATTREAPAHDLLHVVVHCVLLHPFVGSAVDGPSWDLAADIVAESLVAELMGRRAGERGEQMASAMRRLDRELPQALTTERLYRALRDGAFADERARWERLFHVDDHGLWPSAGGSGAGEGDGPAHAGGNGSAAGSGASPGVGAGELAQQDPRAAQEEDAPSGTAPSGKSPQEGADGAGAREGAGDGTPDASGSAGGAPAGDDAPAPLSDAERREAEAAWSRAGKSLRVDLETLSRTRGANLGKLRRELDVSAHERIDYRDFLRQFAVEHEDMRLSDDEFDYIFYTYGLELYHDMPLIEPLEYRSERRIRDFAIVIDTSSSVSEKVVQEFVNTTFDVLSSEGGFFAQTNIHIIQADARVQSDAKITSLADLDRWRRQVKLYGFGGTDFRPAFAYVQKLRQSGEFEDLQGLIYFTDGWGIYPDRMPPYKCAFVFYDEDHRPELVPPWAIQVVLHPGQYESLSVY